MITVNTWYYSVAFLILSIITIPFINYSPLDSFELKTSVWCFKDSRQRNLCKFKNICYDHQYNAFLFFLSENSIIKGFDHYNELQKIELSSVEQHNQFYANLSIINVKNFKLTKKLIIHSKVFLLSRFKPNNLMHCIHDDLFPLYLTLEFICLGDAQCGEDYSLVFHDNHPSGPFFYLYELFSKHPPIVLNELRKNSSHLSCFKEMQTGLVQDSVIYQYGFKKPHGPIKSNRLTQNDISRFTLFVKNKLKVFNKINGTAEIILLNREKNRKILNIDKVREMINNVYRKLNKKINIKQINLNLYSNDLKTLIKIISNAGGLIGMHGAEMILSLFLKPKSFVFEIFPFGINPDIVSFIKPISEVNGCNFIYFSWKNMLRNNSVSHPDAPCLFGGISHLDERTQINIKNAEEVPPVECCNNPLFLYYMYQDTLISDDFENFLYGSLLKIFTQPAVTNGNEIINKWFHPYKVYNFSCIFQLHKNLLHINWNRPFNIQNDNDLSYSLYIKDKKGLFNKEIITEKTNLQIEMPAGIQAKFQVWISVYLNNFKSSDLYVSC